MKRYAETNGTALEAIDDLRRVDWTPEMDDEERSALLNAALPGADAMVISPWTWATMPRFTPERWAKATGLNVIAGTFDNRFGDWLDVRDALRRGVTVIDTSRSMTPTVAELALAMTLNVLRNIPAAIEIVRAGAWKQGPWDQPSFVYGDLTGRRVGLAGYGSINRRYAELLAPFHCAVMAYDPFVPDADLDQLGIQRVDSLPELAGRSEIFVVGIPPTPATQQIISEEVIDALPQGARSSSSPAWRSSSRAPSGAAPRPERFARRSTSSHRSRRRPTRHSGRARLSCRPRTSPAIRPIATGAASRPPAMTRWPPSRAAPPSTPSPFRTTASIEACCRGTLPSAAQLAIDEFPGVPYRQRTQPPTWVMGDRCW